MLENEIQSIVEETDYLAHFQFGLKHGYVTETALALLVDDLCWNLDVVSIFLDHL